MFHTLLLLFYLLSFLCSEIFIVLLILLCHVCYCDACKSLHGPGICVWLNFIQTKPDDDDDDIDSQITVVLLQIMVSCYQYNIPPEIWGGEIWRIIRVIVSQVSQPI